MLNTAANVNFNTGASRGRFIQIRGVGLRSQFVDPVNPSVGLLIDGINYSGLGGSSLLFDTQQAEIYRGPQGTRFGADAMAGTETCLAEPEDITIQVGNETFTGEQVGGGITPEEQLRVAEEWEEAVHAMRTFGVVTLVVAGLAITMPVVAVCMGWLSDSPRGRNALACLLVLYVLTLVTALFVPLQFLTGVWGMNFRVMPELEWEYGYEMFWCCELLIALLVFIFFRASGLLQLS